MSNVSRRVFLGGASATLAIPVSGYGHALAITEVKKSWVETKEVEVMPKSGKKIGKLKKQEEDVEYTEKDGVIIFETPFRVSDNGRGKLRFHKMMTGGKTFDRAKFICDEPQRTTINFMGWTRYYSIMVVKIEVEPKPGAAIPTSAVIQHEYCIWCHDVLYCSSEPFCIECDGLYICSETHP